MSEHVQRCRQMIEEQVAQLGTLRNANPRDAGFKLWRQNTLTVLQRVWPGDSTRSERFRRIAFTPSHGKPDGQTLRDWYTRGCTDAAAYLNALLEMIAREGVPPAPSVARRMSPTSAWRSLPSGSVGAKKASPKSWGVLEWSFAEPPTWEAPWNCTTTAKSAQST